MGIAGPERFDPWTWKLQSMYSSRSMEGVRTSILTIGLFLVLGAFATEPQSSNQAPSQADRSGGAAYDQLGVESAQRGDLSAAIEEFHSALRLDPKEPNAWYHLGLAYNQSRQTDDAMAG